MENFFSTEVILAIIGAVSAGLTGIAGLVKWVLNRRDEAQKKVFEARDKDKSEMKEDINALKGEVKGLKRHVNNLIAIVLKCKNQECPSKESLAAYLENSEKEENL